MNKVILVMIICFIQQIKLIYHFSNSRLYGITRDKDIYYENISKINSLEGKVLTRMMIWILCIILILSISVLARMTTSIKTILSKEIVMLVKVAEQIMTSKKIHQ